MADGKVLENRWPDVLQTFVLDGGTDGTITVPSASGFFVRQIVSVLSSTQPRITLEVKRVPSPTTIVVGPVGRGYDGSQNVDAYKVADGAQIYAGEQQRPGDNQDFVLRHIYQEEPAVALRVLMVDQFGTPIGSDGIIDADVNVATWGGSATSLGQKDSAHSVPVVLASDQSTVNVDVVDRAARQLGIATAEISEWLGSAAPTVGQKAMASSLPVAIASDQSLITVGIFSGTSPSLPVDVGPYGDMHVTLDNRTGAVDAFGRFRASNPVTQFSSALCCDKQALFWDEALTGGATSTYLMNESAVEMLVGTASGDKVVRQSKKYAKYQPGKSLLVLMSFLFGTGVTNVRRRVGYFDDKNGIFLEQSGSSLSFVVRSYVSGSPVDNVVSQASWNIDPMDGTGPSGVNLDISKAQIFLCDLEWLGVGSVRVGFVVDGHLFYAHRFNHANLTTSVYMSSGSEPCRYEIENLAAQGSSHTMKAICASVSSEGGFEDLGVARSAISGTTPKAAPNIGSAAIPLVSIRLRADRPHAQLIPWDIDLVADSADGLYYQIVLNPTLTAATWTDVDSATSVTQYDNSATAYSGGTVLQEGFIDQQSRAGIHVFIPSNLTLGVKLDGTTDTLTIVVNQLFGSGSANAYGVMRFRELI